MIYHKRTFNNLFILKCKMISCIKCTISKYASLYSVKCLRSLPIFHGTCALPNLQVLQNDLVLSRKLGATTCTKYFPKLLVVVQTPLEMFWSGTESASFFYNIMKLKRDTYRELFVSFIISLISVALLPNPIKLYFERWAFQMEKKWTWKLDFLGYKKSCPTSLQPSFQCKTRCKFIV